MNLRCSQLIRTSVAAMLCMASLAACEKGVFMKDTRITTPDFKITTQQPGAEAEVKSQFEIDLKSLMVSDNGVVDEVPSWTGVLEFTLNNKTLGQEKRVQLSANAVLDKVKSGKIETKAGEPVITYRAKCAGVGCAKYYLVVAFHFYDDQARFLDMKFLVIGWYRDLKQVRRALLENDLSHITLQKQVEVMEAMDPAKTIPPTVAPTGVEAATGSTGHADLTDSAAEPVLTGPGEAEPTLPKADGELAPTGSLTAPSGDIEPATAMTGPTGPSDEAEETDPAP